MERGVGGYQHKCLYGFTLSFLSTRSSQDRWQICQILPVCVSPIFASTTLQQRSSTIPGLTIIFVLLTRGKTSNARFFTVYLTHSTVSSNHLKYFKTPLHCHCRYPTAEMAVVHSPAVLSRLVSQAVERQARNGWAGRVRAAQGGTVRAEKSEGRRNSVKPWHRGVWKGQDTHICLDVLHWML